MVLRFTTVDILGNDREYAWWFSTMEYALDVLSSLCASGKYISKAELIDQGHHTTLPVEAFDGSSLSMPIQELENQWLELLYVPGDSTWPLASW
ncbi:hypothetical protein [Spirosoma linguale]|uniref:Uncharacterized protein n=1 Tax=Spirosoma linguale (strain ATCC 33905 / DSM 74 / LMG 10896 / Claus 1) TaxID=504472 RepID=D2QL04_SPILD|nr:hypothetical protein Slin_1192 [Spirosoma linguale DSM 74]